VCCSGGVVSCRVLPCVAMCCSVLDMRSANTLQHQHMQYTAIHCNATHFHTLQHSATQCSWHALWPGALLVLVAYQQHMYVHIHIHIYIYIYGMYINIFSKQVLRAGLPNTASLSPSPYDPGASPIASGFFFEFLDICCIFQTQMSFQRVYMRIIISMGWLRLVGSLRL